jgi:FkbM family methyltransferase
MVLRAFPEAQGVAFEADPRSQRQLTTRFADEPRASLCHRAVSDVDGETVRFHLRPTSATSSLLAPLDEASDTVSAETTTLDAYVAGAGWDRVDLLKVDVEGAEAQVLRGAGGLLRRDGIRAVLCEVRMAAETEGATLLHEVAGLLDQDGYRLHNLYDLVESRARGIIYGNALFLGRGAREDLERRLGPHASTRRLGHG